MDITRVSSICVAGLLGSALMAAAPSSATAQTGRVPVAKYAEAVCGALSNITSADDAIGKRFAAGPVNFGSQQAALDYVTSYQKVWAEVATTLATVSPSVPNGEQIGGLFVGHATKAVNAIQKAIDTFKAVDPTSRAYMGAQNSFGYDGAVSITPRLGDPLRMVTERSVRDAFTREKTCAGLFASLAVGPVTEFLSSVRPFEITAGPDGHVWFTDRDSNKLAKIDPRIGKITEFPVPLAAQAIAAGPDGHVWFTERDRTAVGLFATPTVTLQIGRLDPKSGKVTQFPIPAANARPTGITAGPDGHVWFGDRNGNQIGKIDPATGQVTLFPLPTANPQPRNPNGQPGRITVGPDGHLWFTGTVQIGKIDPATGVITMFSLPTANSRPLGITAGPDGKSLWFTNTGANLIGRIDPATGTVTEFPVPTPAAGLMGITAGCDGNVWFTENNGNKIAKIDPATGKVTEFSAPTAGSQPAWMTSGPDGHVWFTEEIAEQIGKLDLGNEKDERRFQVCRPKT